MLVMQVLLQNKKKLRFKLLIWLNLIGLFNLNNISKKYNNNNKKIDKKINNIKITMKLVKGKLNKTIKFNYQAIQF
jgi:hypothetical protein